MPHTRKQVKGKQRWHPRHSKKLGLSMRLDWWSVSKVSAATDRQHRIKRSSHEKRLDGRDTLRCALILRRSLGISHAPTKGLRWHRIPMASDAFAVRDSFPSSNRICWRSCLQSRSRFLLPKCRLGTEMLICKLTRRCGKRAMMYCRGAHPKPHRRRPSDCRHGTPSKSCAY